MSEALLPDGEMQKKWSDSNVMMNLGNGTVLKILNIVQQIDDATQVAALQLQCNERDELILVHIWQHSIDSTGRDSSSSDLICCGAVVMKMDEENGE